MIARHRRTATWQTALGLALLLTLGCAGLTDRTQPQSPPHDAFDLAADADGEQTEAQRHTLERLQQPIDKIAFNDLTAEEALHRIGEAASVTIVVNGPALVAAGVEPNARLSNLELRRAPAASVLRLVLDQMGEKRVGDRIPRNYVDFDVVEDGTVQVSTAEDLALPDTRVMAYDINDMVGEVPNATDDRELDESAQEIIKLIQETVDPDNWRDAGGRVSSIREHNGVLIVNTTPRNHREIHGLIEQLREQRAITISYEMRFLSVDPNFLDEIGLELDDLKDAGGEDDQARGAYLNDITVNFLLRAIRVNRRAALLAISRVTAFNGQRAYIAQTTPSAYIERIDIHSGDDGVAFQPRISTVHNGYIIEVAGTISADRTYVTLDVHPRLSKLNRFEEKPAPGVPAELKGSIQVPDIDRWEVRQTVSVPDKSTLLMVLRKAEANNVVELGLPGLGGKVPIPDRLMEMVTDDSTILFMIKPTIFAAEREKAPPIGGS